MKYQLFSPEIDLAALFASMGALRRMAKPFYASKKASSCRATAAGKYRYDPLRRGAEARAQGSPQYDQSDFEID